MSEKRIFLLGAKDLEMETIASLLESANEDYKTLDVCWSDAHLDKHEAVIKNNPDSIFYGVELLNDGTDNKLRPKNYIKIDHHNDYLGQPSSLEQVAEILGVKLTREQQLIAANDCGYIDAMKSMDATDDECNAIRKMDRKAQGCTPEDELKAQQLVAGLEKNSSVMFVDAQGVKFTPIVDLLYPCDNLFVYNNDTICYYGKCVPQVKGFYEEHEKRAGYKKKSFYQAGDKLSGIVGTESGYYSSDEIADLVSKLKEMSEWQSRSYHVFYFPFKWKVKGYEGRLFSEQVSLCNLPKMSESVNWQADNKLSDDEQQLMFNEKNYFYQFAHKVLYDEGADDTLIRHYERYEPKVSDTKYIIHVKQQEPYILDLESINLNFYSTGVGILSFFVKNDKYTTVDDVLKINQFGRRIFPPYYDDLGFRDSIAEKLGISGLNSGVDENDYIEDFNRYDVGDSWKPACFISKLIEDYCSALIVEPVIDDRMFVNCWYGNTVLSNRAHTHPNFSSVKSDKSEADYVLDQFLDSELWYKYIFVDVKSATCQNNKMKRDLIDKSSYTRWQKDGKMYGCSHYSMVALTDSSGFACNVLAKHMRGIYSRMVELILIQRASMLRFSGEVSIVSNLSVSSADVGKRISSLYKEYIMFINQVYFREVTAQEQGVEMYHKLMEQFDSKEQIKDLDSEIGELHNYVTLLNDAARNENSYILGLIAMIFLPISVVTGLFGVNKIKDLENEMLLPLSISVVITIGLWIFYKRRERK